MRAPCAHLKNPKSEARNPKQIQNSNIEGSKQDRPPDRPGVAASERVCGFEHLIFGFRVCFGFRISDFG
jgi:hypothetical protein